MASIISAGTTAGTALNVTPDTSGNLAFQTQAGANTITLPNATGTLATTAQLTRFKNRIINGDMRIDQRNAGAAVTYNNVEAVYNIDRWQAGAIGGGVFTVQQSSTAPVGFTTSQKYTVTTADTSIASTDRYSMYQYIEGYNVSDLGFGTANAKTFTISFWIQSSVIGQYGVAVYNSGFDRAIVNTITINTANTWEYKSVTFTADTSGTWNTTNGVGLRMAIVFAMGSSYQGTANTWTSGFIGTTSSQVNWMATNGNTLYISGVQLEVGSSATGFEYVDYGTQLVQCQRYYEKTYDMAYAQGSATSAGLMAQPISSAAYPRFVIPFQVRKRTAPSLRYWDPNGTENQWVYWNNGSVGYSGFSNQTINETSMSIELNNGTTFAVRANVAGQWAASAEL